MIFVTTATGCRYSHRPTDEVTFSCKQSREVTHRSGIMGRYPEGMELFRDFTLTDREISAVGVDMAQREKPIFVYDANGSIGVVMEFSESDFEAYSMPDLALIGAFRTKAQAAQALASRSRQLRH
jgi:hypothetical protein